MSRHRQAREFGSLRAFADADVSAARAVRSASRAPDALAGTAGDPAVMWMPPGGCAAQRDEFELPLRPAPAPAQLTRAAPPARARARPQESGESLNTLMYGKQ